MQDVKEMLIDYVKNNQEKLYRVAFSYSKNEKLKTVIILRFFEDMKIEEIAKITKTNQNTVKSRLYKGLKELKKMIKNEQKGW